MQIRADKLRETLKLLEPAVASKRTTLPATTYIFLSSGRAIANNLETSVTVESRGGQRGFTSPDQTGVRLSQVRGRIRHA